MKELPIKCAIFDMDGTVLDSSYVWSGDDATLESVKPIYASTVFDAKPGIPRFLASLKEHGVKTAIATGNLIENAENALVNAGLRGYFDGIYSPESVGGIKKAEPVLFTKIAADFGCLPEEAVVFEDAMHNLRSAIRGGFGTIGVYDEPSADREAEMIELVDIQIRSYDELEVTSKDGVPTVRTARNSCRRS